MSTIGRWIHIAVMRNVKQLVLPHCLVNHPDSLEVLKSDLYQHFLKHQNMKKSGQSKATIPDYNVDRISSLPDPILHMILSRLHSTEEVIQTSVLSTRWKYLWTSIPSLNFHCYRGKSRRDPNDKNKFKEFVYWVLANRILDLDSFTLIFLDNWEISTIWRWIDLLVMRKIKQLDLKFFCWNNGRVIVLPRCLVDCDSLEVFKLELSRNILNLSSFTGSRTLKVLKFCRVGLLDHELVREFLVNCPLLEELNLIDCLTSHLDYLSIPCPNLKTLRIKHPDLCERLMVLCPKLMYLEYGGCMAKLANRLQFDVRSLKKAVIEHEYIEQKDEIAICKLFAQVSHVEYLSVNYFFVKSISSGCECFDCPEEGLPKALPNLKTLELTIDCYKMELLILILKYSPNLESLHLIIHMDTEPEEYEAFVEELNEVETRRILTRHLKKVKFLNFRGEKEDLAIAHILLEHGNRLEEMVFSWYTTEKYREKSLETVNEVSKFYKASLCVKVITLFTSFWPKHE